MSSNAGQIRSYCESDFDRCVEIVNDIWGFDQHLKLNNLAELIKNSYVSTSLSDSNFVVVVEEKGRVEGFLFGRCGDKPCFLTSYSGVMGKLYFLWQLFSLKAVPLAKKVYFFNLFRQHEKSRNRVEPDKSSEVNLFAVGPDNQGKGYGRLMMLAFIEYCQQVGAKRITLETDRECNYGFYDHLGFQVLCEFYSPLQKEYSGNSGDNFVYELKLKS